MTKDNAVGTGSPRIPSQLAAFTGSGSGQGRNRKDQLPVGRKLAHYQAHWTKLFPLHPEIVRKVSQGILIAFDDATPSLLRYPLELPSNNKTADLLHPVPKLQVSQAIEEAMDTASPGYYSRLFLVPKPDGSFRSIIALEKLNQFIVVPSFKMETLFSIITALQPQEWITKIDLKDAYHHILVYVNIWKYFRFVVAGVVYQFRVLPFGLSMAPREFTKTLAPMVQLLHTQGVRAHAYLDDWIMRANSQNGVWNIHNKLFNFFSLWVERSTQTSQCYNPHTFWTFWFYISTWNEPLFLLRTLSYQLSPMSYPVCLHQQSCLLAKFHPSAGCHILPRSYTVAVFTYAFSSSGSKPSGLTISSRGIHQSSWMRTSSPTFTGFTDEMWWQAFRYIFRNPAYSSLRMHPWRDGAPVVKTIRYPDYGNSRITTLYPLARTGSHTTCATSLGTSVAQSICESLLRKQYSSSVHPQIGGNTFSVPVLQDPGTVRSPGSVCDNSPENQKNLGEPRSSWLRHNIQAVAPASSTVEHTSLNYSPGRQLVPVCAQLQMPPNFTEIQGYWI